MPARCSVAAVILRNARLVGAGVGRSDIYIDEGRIGSVTPSTTSAGSVGAPGGAVETVDLDGRWVLPGLWDHHVHFEQWAISRDRLDLSGADSAAEAAESIRAAVAARSSTADLLVAVGYRDALWPDQPDVDLLDRAAGQVAVVAISADLHAVWLNLAALRRFGFDASGGGVRREDDAFAVQLAIADRPSRRIEDLTAQAARAAAARGVVGIIDFEQPDNGPAWQQRIAGGLRSLRVVCSVWPQQLDSAIRRGDRAGAPLAGTDGLATMGPLKVIIDGSLNTRTAYCFEPYPGASGGDRHGLLTVTPDELAALLTRARGGGLNAAVHAIGDHANALALDAFESVGVAPGNVDHRRPSTIEHAQLISPADAKRMAHLGLVASVQPEHVVDDRDVADRYWAGRTDRAFAFRTLLDAGVELRLGSDAPVAPLDPWIAIAAAVDRTRSDRIAWHPEQRISLAEALRASTAASTLRAGNAADLVVIDRNPLECSGEQLRSMPVAATMLAGNWTHGTLGRGPGT